MSAFSKVAAALGGGSNVWELVPSGTMPVTTGLLSPTTREIRFVIGATVETMRAGRPEIFSPARHAALAAFSDPLSAVGSAMLPSVMSWPGCSTTSRTAGSEEHPATENRSAAQVGIIKNRRIMTK